MSHIGECEDCGRTADLQYPPEPQIDRTRPSVCKDCYYAREEHLRYIEDQIYSDYPTNGGEL